MLVNKISASEFSQKSVKGALLVGKRVQKKEDLTDDDEGDDDGSHPSLL